MWIGRPSLLKNKGGPLIKSKSPHRGWGPIGNGRIHVMSPAEDHSRNINPFRRARAHMQNPLSFGLATSLLSRLWVSNISGILMKPSRRFSYFSSSATTVTYTFRDYQIAPRTTTEIPIFNPPSPPIPIAVHLPQSDAAAKIQSAYRAHIIRNLYKTISSVNSQADHLQRQIQRQETVDAVRSNEKERLRMSEALMSLLLRLDSVPGYNPTVREARRKVSRRIVGLQEILDGICEAKMVGAGWEWDPYGGGCCGGFSRGFDQMLAGMEEEFCRDRGGEEMERFCAQYLGFRCLQRFLQEP